MKTIVLLILTLCVAHAEITRHRLKSSQGRHQGRRLGKAARSLEQVLRRHRGIRETLASRRVARSVFHKDYSSGYGDDAMGDPFTFSLDVDWGSGIASGFDYDSSFWVNEEIDLEESESESESQTDSNSRRVILSKTKSETDGAILLTDKDQKTTTKQKKSDSSNLGIVDVLKLPKRIEKRSLFNFFPGSGDAGSGSRGAEEDNNIVEIPESSGAKFLDKVILSTNVIQRQYSRAGVPESVATSLGSGGGDSDSGIIASNGIIMCAGDIGCDDHGSGGIIRVNPAEEVPIIMRKPAHSTIGRETNSNNEFLGSGMHAIGYHKQQQ